MKQMKSFLSRFSSSGSSGKEDEENQSESFDTGEECLQDNSTQVQNEENVENNCAPKIEATLVEKEATIDRYIQLSGLSLNTTGKDISEFLVDCRTVGNVLFIKNDHGKPCGQAIVKLKDESELKKALKLNKTYLKSLYIVIEEATHNTYEKHNDQPKETETSTSSFAKLGSLVWSASVEDIENFLKGCNIMEVVIKRDERGRPSGNAFVQFESNIDIGIALKYNKKYLRERWVSVEQIKEDEFIKAKEEDQKPICKNQETISRHNDEPMLKETSNITFVKLGSLTWSATEEDIKTFLKGCKIREVVITKNERGKPSGNAFVCLESKADVEKAKTYNRKYLGKRWVTVDEIGEDEYDKETEKDKASGTTVKLGSLSWSATEDDIKHFLHGCNIKEIIITTNERGKPSGNAFVLFESKADAEKAKTYNKKYLGERWVTVDEIGEDEYIKETEKDKASGTTVKLGSLSWSATEDDIKHFLDGCNIKEIIITTNESGKPSGNAFVLFERKADVEKAKTYNRKYLGERWVTVDEIEEDDYIKETERDRKLTTAEANSCFYLKLSSLAWGATKPELLQFFQNCKVKKVLILKNHLGRPSGEAIMEVVSKEDQTSALIQNNSTLGGRSVVVKKLNYVELTRFIKQNLNETSDDQEFREALMSFCAKPETNVDELGVTKDIDTISYGAVRGPGTHALNKKPTGHGAAVAPGSIEGELEKADFVEYMQTDDGGGKNHSSSPEVKTYKFEIKLWDNVEDEEEVLEDCKDVEFKGVVWEKGDIYPVSEGKSKIILGCTVMNDDPSAELIKKSLEDLASVEDVQIIQ